MRAPRWLWLMGQGSAVAAFAFAASACGGSSSTAPSNSGSDASTAPDSPGEGASEAGMGVDESSAPEASEDASAEAEPLVCAIDADLSHLDVPDASIGDSGVNLASCYGCIQTSCGDQVSACTADCTCRLNVAGLVGCAAGGTTFTACFSKILTSADPATAGLIVCLLASSCPAKCGA